MVKRLRSPTALEMDVLVGKCVNHRFRHPYKDSDTNDPVDFADFASRNEDRIAPETVRMLEPTDLVQLPKGEAFALIHGGQLHKIRMPLPSASSDALMPTSLAAIGEMLRARLDGPWNQPEEASEPEDRRDV